MARDKIVGITSGLVKVFRVLNVLFGVAAILVLIATFAAHDQLAARLFAKYGRGFAVEATIWGLRAVILIGLIAVGVVERLLKNLGEVLATLKLGDPFAPANATRITIIAWMLLTWQLLELALFAIGYLISRTGADVADWTPSIGGWLAVLVAFVLARVFAAGSRMRDELAATI